LLAEFDDGKRSCRKRLAGHNERRRKPQVGLQSGRTGRLLHPYGGKTCIISITIFTVFSLLKFIAAAYCFRFQFRESYIWSWSGCLVKVIFTLTSYQAVENF